jgi:hypothetical protein
MDSSSGTQGVALWYVAEPSKLSMRTKHEAACISEAWRSDLVSRLDAIVSAVCCESNSKMRTYSKLCTDGCWTGSDWKRSCLVQWTKSVLSFLAMSLTITSDSVLHLISTCKRCAGAVSYKGLVTAVLSICQVLFLLRETKQPSEAKC